MGQKRAKMKVSIIVPCYNEQEAITYLKSKLNPAFIELKKKYDIELIFVDDGSKDKTYELLKNIFGKRKYAKIVRHKQNMNLGAAIRTGIQNATGDIICTIDSDCSYDPMVLKGMIKKTEQGYHIVSASPFHPKGRIISKIPPYRLFLSKAIVAIYNLITGGRQYSYNSLIRAYKREIFKEIKFYSNDFLANAEIMIKSLFKGYKVYEYPAYYVFRKYGVSKIKLLKVIKSHFLFIIKILRFKLFHIEL